MSNEFNETRSLYILLTVIAVGMFSTILLGIVLMYKEDKLALENGYVQKFVPGTNRVIWVKENSNEK